MHASVHRRSSASAVAAVNVLFHARIASPTDSWFFMDIREIARRGQGLHRPQSRAPTIVRTVDPYSPSGFGKSLPRLAIILTTSRELWYLEDSVFLALWLQRSRIHFFRRSFRPSRNRQCRMTVLMTSGYRNWSHRHTATYHGADVPNETGRELFFHAR